MCLISFAFTPGQHRHLLLAANRDEFHDRPTQVMHWWNWPAGPLAGRDERAGGTWLAAGRDGRWAAVTNFRDPRAEGGRHSRGELPVNFVRNRESPEGYVAAIYRQRRQYGAFNLLAGDRESLWYCATQAEPRAVEPGVHALSNGLLDESWPKSRRAATALRRLVGANGDADLERLFHLMDDRKPADDGDLPDTGVGIEVERLLSPPFIVNDRYGTRCTTILSLGIRSLAAERRFNQAGERVGQIRFGFRSPSS